jgi:hypothetical protein
MKIKREVLVLNYISSQKCCIFVGLLAAIMVQNQALSQSTLTPSVRVEESFVTNKSTTLKESGQITTVSPGVRYEIIGAKSSFLADYSLNAIYYNDLSEQDKIDHSLLLRSDIVHSPNHWDTQITGTIKQTNVSPDGVQIVNPQFQSSNNQELRTFGVGTNFRGKLTRSIDYQSSFDVDYADFENSDNTDSSGINLGLNSNTQNKISWISSLSSRRSNASNVSSQIDTARGEINYRFSRQYSTFLTLDKSETDNDFLNDTNSTIGVHWTPSRHSSLRLGVGKRGDDTTYTLDSSTQSSRITYTLNYDESITTSRALTINEIDSQTNLTATSQGLSITPVLLKKGRIGMVITGRRSEVGLSYFHQTTTQSADNIGREISQGLSINATRTLSNSSSIQLTASQQKNKTSQENTVDNFSVGYNRQLGRKVSWSTELRETSQSSNIVANESTQSQLNFRLNATF